MIATAREVLPTQYSRQDLVRAILSLFIHLPLTPPPAGL
jgi:homoserine kinase